MTDHALENLRSCSNCGKSYPADSFCDCQIAAFDEDQSTDGPAIPQPGDTFDRKFEILNVLGKGGMGCVLKARQTLLDHNVALKIINPRSVKSREMLKRFRQEAKTAVTLRHRNIAGVHDFDVFQGQPYIVMDYVEGKTLEELLQKGPLETERALRIFSQIADALSFAHQHGVIHRDIKPGNIMVTTESGEETVKLLDFGIAKIVGSEQSPESNVITQTGEIIGSPLYMSPEQCLGQKIDARTDVYALGCVMYSAICGEAPFKGSNRVEAMYMQMNQTPRRMHEANPKVKVSPKLEQLIFKAMEKQPENRYQSMQELSSDLHNIEVAQLVSQTRDLTRLTRMVLACFSVCAVIVMIVGLIISTQRGQHLVLLDYVSPADDACLRGDWQSAEKLYRSGLQAAERIPLEHTTVAIVLDKLGRLYDHQGDHEQARLCFERELPLRKSAWLRHEAAIATTEDELATQYADLGQFQSAKQWFSEAKSSFELLSRDNADVKPAYASCLRHYAAMLRQNGQTEHAVALEEDAVDIDGKANSGSTEGGKGK
jgi:serine/threonine protein kinase